MKTLIALAFAAASMSFAIATPAMAVDNDISALCRADAAGNSYQRAGGFCDQVASNKSLVGTHAAHCPFGYELNNASPPKCVCAS